MNPLYDFHPDAIYPISELGCVASALTALYVATQYGTMYVRIHLNTSNEPDAITTLP